MEFKPKIIYFPPTKYGNWHIFVLLPGRLWSQKNSLVWWSLLRRASDALKGRNDRNQHGTRTTHTRLKMPKRAINNRANAKSGAPPRVPLAFPFQKREGRPRQPHVTRAAGADRRRARARARAKYPDFSNNYAEVGCVRPTYFLLTPKKILPILIRPFFISFYIIFKPWNLTKLTWIQ